MYSIREIFKGNIGVCLKRLVYNSCAMTYGADTWAFTTHAKNNLAAAQTKMERSMLNITYRDRKKHLGKRKNKGDRRDWTSQMTEVDLGRARQQDTR